MKTTARFLILLLVIAAIHGSSFAMIKRDRGDRLHNTISANTMGRGNIWVEGYGMAYIWDNDGKLRLFPHLETRWGILDYLQMRVFSRVLSYSFQFGHITTEIKATLPNNRDIRLLNFGLAIQYERGFMDQFYSSLGGYRREATGFSPEGFLFKKGTTNFILACDVEMIALSSLLPFTGYLNVGYSIANESKFSPFNQTILRTGLEFKGVGVDFFLEGSIKAFNNFTQPMIAYDMGNLPETVYAIWFVENEWYVTPGARMRYSGGLTLTGAISARFKAEELQKGAKLAQAKKPFVQQLEKDAGNPRFDEVNSGYHPFFTAWMVHGSMSFPIRYRQPSSELYRGFLLKKNVKRKRVIDIDETLGAGQGAAEQESEEDRQRLQQIEERKKKVMDEIKLD